MDWESIGIWVKWFRWNACRMTDGWTFISLTVLPQDSVYMYDIPIVTLGWGWEYDWRFNDWSLLEFQSCKHWVFASNSGIVRWMNIFLVHVPSRAHWFFWVFHHFVHYMVLDQMPCYLPMSFWCSQLLSKVVSSCLLANAFCGCMSMSTSIVAYSYLHMVETGGYADTPILWQCFTAHFSGALVSDKPTPTSINCILWQNICWTSCYFWKPFLSACCSLVISYIVWNIKKSTY